MFVKRSTNLLRSAFKLKGTLRQGFAFTKTKMATNRLSRLFMFGVALLPASLLVYCAEEDKDALIFETPANLKDNQTRTIQVGPKEDDTILLVKENGKYYCVQNKCPHYGFPLSKGLLVGDKVICPLHNATFDIKTGRNETGPIYDGLQTYRVEQSGDVLKIYVPKDKINTNKTAPMSKKQNDQNPMVIIGGGPASQAALETLRKAGHKGKIVLITKDDLTPYDRTSLSKNWNNKKDTVVTRKPQFYKEYGIDVMTESPVKSIDYANKQVILQTGKKVDYEKLLIASGCQNIEPTNIPKIPGLNMISLRSFSDFQKIKEKIEALHDRDVKNITILGGGFIGWELASTLKNAYKQKVSITVVDHNAIPHQKIFGSEVAKVLKRIATDSGIHYQSSTTIRGSEGNSEDNQVRNLILTNKNTIPTDMIILAIGVQPVTNFVGDLTIDQKNRGIKTDAFLRTSKKDVFAAGDVASFPYWHTGEQIRIQHYNEAIHQGQVAALNMLDKKFPMDNVPFFWSRAFNQSIQYVGSISSFDEVLVKGDLQKPAFVAYYLKGDKVVAASCMNEMNSIMIIREALKAGVMPNASQIKKEGFKLDSLVQEIRNKKPGCTKCDLLSNQL